MVDREKLIELMDEYEYPSSIGGMADHLIANGVTVQRWIPVTERLPENCMERVLVKIKDANNIIGHPDMDTDRFHPDGWVRWGNLVTHRMPLPDAPKEDA